MVFALIFSELADLQFDYNRLVPGFSVAGKNDEKNKEVLLIIK
jgi:hypothetical protein